MSAGSYPPDLLVAAANAASSEWAGVAQQLYQGTLCLLVPKDQKCVFDLPSFASPDAPDLAIPAIAAVIAASSALLLLLLAGGAGGASSGDVAAAVYPSRRYNAEEADRYFSARPTVVLARAAEILLNRS